MNITRPESAVWSVLPLLFAFGCAVCGAQKESLTIGPGDLVHVKVLEAPELEETARVTDAGNIPLGLGGPVQVGGKAPAAAAATIARALSAGGFILTPHVLVTLEGTVTANVSIMGQVRSPGSYAINTPRPILDVLALAGGLTDVANRTVTIQRHETGERLAFEASNSSTAALDMNLIIFPGDTIIVPKADIVYILGDVNRPGGIAIVTNDSRLSVVQALTLAGGTPPSASPSHARLIRKQSDGSHVDIPLQLSAMQKGKHPDMQLQADDIVYVPFSYMRNMASGAGASVVGSASSAAIYKF
jgi:polysaccharide biosynthesis/export protein